MPPAGTFSEGCLGAVTDSSRAAHGLRNANGLRAHAAEG